MSDIVSTPSTLHPRLRRTFGGFVSGWNRIGRQTQFYGLTIRSIGTAVVHYKAEIVRLIAQMSLGTGALALIGGTVVVVGFLTLSTGALIAVQGYNQLSARVALRRLRVSTSAYINVRIIAPAAPPESPWRPRSARAPPRSWALCASRRRSTRWK